MLEFNMQQEQTFENLIQEARKQIPLYTKEWTNFNPSDPGETILENLSAFSILQQAYIDHMPETVQEKIFQMAGFKREYGKSARVLVEAKNVEEAVHIPSGQRFRIGDMFFETNRDVSLMGNRVLGIYTKWKDEISDYSFILDENYPVSGAVFTDQPKAGMELYLVLEKKVNPGDDLIFHIRLAKGYQRNAFEGKNMFADIQWQIYTHRGFVDVRCKDGTGSLLNSGEISFHLPKQEAEVFTELPQEGYVLRGVLKRADYDIFPKIDGVSGFLFELWQKETKSICYTYSGKEQVIDLYCDILEEGYVQIFCKESKDGGYYLYEREVPWNKKGRFYSLERLDFGRYRIRFDKENFGYGPGNFENAVKLVAYSEEMMRSYDLGTIYGYDDQRVKLPGNHIVKESFSLIALKKNQEGENEYYFIRPSSVKNEELQYELLENEGILVIKDAADFIDSRIFLGGCAISRGAEGNVRIGSRFEPVGYESNIIFTNPAAGKGGCYPEDIHSVRRRLIADLRKHYTAVEAADYENLVRSTPELCIDKVKAVRDDVKNQIQIAVKPVSNKPFPKLSEIYLDAINKRIEKARLLTVNIEVLQPVYVPVHVQGTIYVKSHYEGCREQIEAVIRRQLDYISTERNFGDVFHFDDLFVQIESLACVKYIYDLSVSLTNQLHATQKGLDIQPKNNCLLYPGEIILELNTTE
ncbi:MAG: baseplate J/gp47 family protein [Lachnospiraceae bacterium]|nr:baseplate J/gp47 family protein [Lachnospiraceae bacterium]